MMRGGSLILGAKMIRPIFACPSVFQASTTKGKESNVHTDDDDDSKDNHDHDDGDDENDKRLQAKTRGQLDLVGEHWLKQ